MDDNLNFAEIATEEKLPQPPFLEEELDAELMDDDSISRKLLMMLKKNKLAAFSLLVIVLICVVAAAAPLIAPYDPNAPAITNRFAAPSAEHWFGTDELGRDVFSRLLYGTRISIMIGLVPTLISMTIGTILGLAGGFYGGKIDFVIMRFADIVLAFP